MAIHHVYVVELDEAVWTENRFRYRNLQRNLSRACVYVGMTGRTPQLRLQQHLAGYKANRYVRRYGRGLREDLIPMALAEGGSFDSRGAALRAEVELADALRRCGYAVWQG